MYVASYNYYFIELDYTLGYSYVLPKTLSRCPFTLKTSIAIGKKRKEMITSVKPECIYVATHKDSDNIFQAR